MALRKLSKEEMEEVTIVDPDAASYEDFCEFMQSIFTNSCIHGPVIGVVIQINLCQEQEATIFFADGFVQMSTTPLIGYDIEEDEQYKYNLLASKSLLAQIPLLANRIEGDYVSQRGTSKELKEPQSYGKTCYFVFRPPEDLAVNFSECLGIWSLDEHISVIAQHETSEFMTEINAEGL